ncbi:SURF1 family protein [Sinomonas notoginsengisoli]|uniref:SURF1 family cytochrome oxidase biogenesis protein n=1 Tax=Sinomonas notoginsengisoli TaxID=1457311 RepID=UPI001F1BADBA|nr:SURF1 family protein [Sinomonas notoginsengisoli]
MYRFLVSRRWLTYLSLAIVFAITCVLLSRWQMARLDEAKSNIDRVTRNYDAAPVPFTQATGEFASLPTDSEWKQVELRGSYDTTHTKVVRNRPNSGQPGYEVVVPFRLDSGQTVIVDRGWLPIGNKQAGRPDAIPAPPAREASVVVRLRPSEPALDRGAPEGQLASIDLPGYAQQLPYSILTGAYGMLASENPAPAQPAPASLPKPQPDEGMHLSYALQWLAFAVLMFIGFGYAARQQAKNDAIDAAATAAERAAAATDGTDRGGEAAGATDDAGPPASREDVHRAANEAAARAARFAPRRKRRPTAEEEEDAILDAQGFH